MKRLLALSLLALAACNTQPTTLPADLVSPEALAVSGNEVFVASTNTDELRVLLLPPDGGVRTFAPAPNPIYVLSIPVATRPVALAPDVDATGATGAYVFSLSTVTDRIGAVVVADQREEAEVALPGTPLSMVARTVSDGGAGARLYVGLALGNGQGAVATVDVPPPSALFPDGGTPLTAQVAYDLGTAAPAAIDLSPDGQTLAIGDSLAPSGAAAADAGGGLIFVSLDGGGLTRVDVGGPAGRVLYNPEAVETPNSNDVCTFVDGGTEGPAPINPGTVAAGQFVYVLVQSTGCPLGERCGGVQTVHDGQVVNSSPGIPQPPARIPGAVTDLAVATSTVSGGNLRLGGVDCLTGNSRPRILVAAPSTNGFVYFLDGETGRIFNAATPGTPPTTVSGVVGFLDGGTVDVDAGQGPQSLDAGPGGLDTQEIVVAYLGNLPVLIDRNATVVSSTDGGTIADILSDPAADFVSLGVQIGDVVDFAGGGATTGCTTEATVTGVSVGELQLLANPPITPDCYPLGGTGSYTVHVATAAQPYVVLGTAAGYLGRVASGQTFFSTVPYLYPGLPSFDPAWPALSFTMGSGLVPNLADGGGDTPGAEFVFSVQSGVTPNNSGGGANAIQPQPAVWAPADLKFYVGYPGSALGSELSEIDPAAVEPGTSSGVQEYQ